MANLNEADLLDAKLNGARLNGADLSGVELSGADFSEANLSRARGLSEEQLAVSVGDAKTQLPDGIRRPTRWPAAEP